jgi:hypothetical protein
LGYEHAELLRHAIADMVDSDRVGEFTSLLQTLSRENHCRCETGLRTKTQQDLDVDLKVTTVTWNGEKVFLGIGRDITEQKRQDRFARAQNEIARIIAVDQDIASSARDLLQVLGEAFQYDIGILWQRVKDPEHLSALGLWSKPQAMALPLIAQSQICAEDPDADLISSVLAIGAGRSSSCREGRWAATSRWQAARDSAMRHVVACPTQSGSDTIGVVELWSQCDPRDESIGFGVLQTLVNQIGQFLDRKRVEKELRDAQARFPGAIVASKYLSQRSHGTIYLWQ